MPSLWSRYPACVALLALCLGRLGGLHGWPLRALAGAGFVILAVGLLASRSLRPLRVLMLIGWAAVGAWSALPPERPADWPRGDRPFYAELVGTLSAPVASRFHGGRQLRLAVGAGTDVRLRIADSESIEILDRLRAGDRIRTWARLTVRDRWVTGSVKNALLVERIERGGGLGRSVDELRRRARARIESRFEHLGTQRLLRALLLGEREALDPSTESTFRRAGLTHLLVVSGLHVAPAVALLLALVARRDRGLAGWHLAAVLALTILPGWFGPRPPVVRAVVVAALAIGGRSVRRDARALNSLALFALAIAVVRSAWWSSPSFQLTTAATAGILLFLPSARGQASSRLRAAWTLGRGAYLGALPLVAWHFGYVAPVAVLAGLVAGPLCLLVLVAGFGGLLLPGPWVGLAESSVAALGALAASVEGLGIGWSVPRPHWVLLASYTALLFVRAAWPRNRWAATGFGLAVVLLHLPPPAGDGVERASVLDVGQGQAVLLTGGKGRCVLIDAGPAWPGGFDAGERIVVPELLARGCRRLSALIVTHAHQDHAGGAEAVLDRLAVDSLWVGIGTLTEARVSELTAAARDRGIPVVGASRGSRSRLAGWELEVLHPGRQTRDLDLNDASLVLRATTADGSLLVPGDLAEAGERKLLDSGQALRSDLLVVGHHGARRSSTPAFLDAVAPRRAVVSCGRFNRFGHPSPETRVRLTRRGVPTWTTAEDGAFEWVPSSPLHHEGRRDQAGHEDQRQQHRE